MQYRKGNRYRQSFPGPVPTPGRPVPVPHKRAIAIGPPAYTVPFPAVAPPSNPTIEVRVEDVEGLPEDVKERVVKLIGTVDTAIARAEKGSSKVIPSLHGIEGWSGEKIQHLLNNLNSNPWARYLEIGPRFGKTLCAALYQNTPQVAFAMDIAYDQKLKNNMQNFGTKVEMIHGDCWTVDKSRIQNINVYFYDAGHSTDDHIKAVTHYVDNMDDFFIMLIDDWMGALAPARAPYRITRDATLEGIKQAELVIYKAWELGQSRPASDAQGYWNGLGVFVLGKSIEQSDETPI